MCCICSKSLIDLSKRVYVCETYTDEEIKQGDALYWCKDCKDNTDHDYKRVKLKSHLFPKDDEDEDKSKQSKKFLDNLFEDYHN